MIGSFSQRVRRRFVGQIALLFALGGALYAPGLAGAQAGPALVVHDLRGCLHSLSAGERTALDLRFGIGGRPQQPASRVAGRLHRSLAVESAVETQAIAALGVARQAGSCTGPMPSAVAAGASSTPTPALSDAAVRYSPSRSQSGGLKDMGLLILAGLMFGGLLVGAAGELRGLSRF